ncbi:MAG: biopolymer transporter ExbD [Treponema sp.]|nr:biopolymer transporter ExbD [Treponema sp.]
MKLKARRRSVQASVDMTPMLDVVFQLIIFFLVSTTFAVLPGISLNLPESVTAESTSNLGITITADKNGGLWFNDKSVTFKTLSDELSSFDTKKIKKAEYPITIEADDQVTNGTIVKLFDIIRANGFAAVNLRTTDKK